MGYSIKDFAVQNEIDEEFSEESFINGIKAAFAGNEEVMSRMDAQMHVQQFIMAQQQAMQSQGQEDAMKTLDEGLAFLEENKNRDEVIVTESGLQYEIITKGTGNTPTDTDNVEVHYHGTLIDGTVFDSSVDRDEAATFQVGGVIAGWTEALQLMKEGSKWKLYIPSDLAYGDRQRSELIKANSTLIFEVELIDVK
ncbi:MAG: FKBP-type peptidyl-prolyl cis-trans isomerase [Bacteroidales bacterium]|nr:FKBP-type peptidyl-prolyl cis-trans isomerase [Bacteroidales bacterium]